MSNKFNGVDYDSSEQQCGPGESPSSDAIDAAYAAVARHKEALAVPPAMFSRHSPEGIDEVLESAQREDVKLTASEAARERAKRAADLLDAWARGEMLEWRGPTSEGWREYEDSLRIPNVIITALEWRVKRTPRKVYVAFHESGSVADVRATPTAIDMPGMPGRLASDYVEFEEKLS